MYYYKHLDGEEVTMLQSSNAKLREVQERLIEISKDEFEALREQFLINLAQAYPPPEQTVENDLLSMAVDHEYRLTILELGVV